MSRFPFRPQAEPLQDRWLPSYTLTDLGTLGGRWSSAADLNAAGQVVGSAETGQVDADGTPVEHGFVWNDGAMTDLGTLGGSSSYAGSINDLGQVVGSAERADGTFTGFLINPEDADADGTPDRWFRDADADGANDLMVELPVGAARDINNLGQVVFKNRLWTPDVPNGVTGTLTDLGPTVTASAVNDAGQVVGTTEPAPGGYRIFLWQDGAATDLGAGTATDINAAGQITGHGPGFGLSVYYGAFVWTPATPNGTTGAFAELVPVEWYYGVDYTYSEAYGLNDAGEVVGRFARGSFGGEGGWDEEVGVLWSGGQMYDLGQLVVPVRTIRSAAVINNAGQIVSGSSLLTPDGPALRIGDVTVTEGNTGTRSATFTVTLSAASGEVVTVDYATANGTAAAGSDYAARSGTLTFAPGETSKTVSVSVYGDRRGEADETFAVNLTGPTGATISDGHGVGAIRDDEPRMSVGDVTKAEGRKGRTTLFTFTVTLSAAYDQAVTVSFRTANGTASTAGGDYVAKTGTLTFAPGETTKTITIVVKGDGKKEADEYFYFDLFDSSGNSLVTKSRGTGTILNDD